MKRIRDKLLVPLDDEFREMLGFLFSITVVFIVGTLALGMYKDGLYKSRVSEILSHAPDIKVQFYEHYAVNHVFPDAELIRNYLATKDGMSLESYEIFAEEKTKISGAVITVSIISDLPEIDGGAFSFTALKDDSKGVLIWLCGYASHQDYPFANAYSRTTLKREYMPSICRD
jgi:hypothetical protein